MIHTFSKIFKNNNYFNKKEEKYKYILRAIFSLISIFINMFFYKNVKNCYFVFSANKNF